ncbi:MAG: ribosomal protein small subunit ribosomal protein [Candidatus Parcubacteria bacterium]|jgi:small subunit ribosomal protein S2
MTTKETTINKEAVEAMFKVGAHFGYTKSRRHPSTSDYIFGAKNRIEIFDLEKTSGLLDAAKQFVEEIAAQGKQILFVSGKREAMSVLKDAAVKIDQPYVSGRWIGGTLTNFEQIQKRVQRLEKLLMEKEKGLLAKYTKKERLLIDREIEKLKERFGGIVNMKTRPGAVFIVDVKQEDNATAEAVNEKLPIVSLSSSDCDITKVTYPILANDNGVHSISYVLAEIVAAYQAGAKRKATKSTA